MSSTIANTRRFISTLALTAAFTMGAPLALAQGDKAGAESLFQAGKVLMDKGRFADACPKFVESHKLDPSVGTLLNLGKCYEKQGKTASAWAEYKGASVLARSSGQADREAAAIELAKALEPKLSKIQIEATAPVPGLAIRRDGAAVGMGTLGIPLAVDPGEHAIEANATGYKTWRANIVIGPNGDVKTVTVPTLEPDPTAVASPAPTTEPTAAAPISPAPSSPSSGTRTAAYVLGGVGIASLGVGAVFGIMASGDASDAESDETLCPGKVCTPAGRAQIDSAETKALISTIAIPVGLAAVGAGVVLFIMSGSSSKEAATRSPHPTVTQATVVPTAGPTGGGLTFVGRF